MKKLLLSLFAICALCFGFSSCQPEPETPEKKTGSIYGVVSNSKTGEPIQGVSVTLSPSNLTTVTGYDGHYEFVKVEAGQYKIYCQADGFEPNYQPITVKEGLASTADIILTPEQTTASFQLSTTTLDFGTQYTELAFDITNTGTAGAIDWSISGVSVPWLKINPASGTLGMGKSDVIIASIDRTAVKQDEMTYIKVNAAGSSKSITVRVKYVNTDEGEKEEPKDEPKHSFELSTTTLDFGKTYDELTLSVTNTGTAGDMTWSVNSISESWLTVTPMSGTLGMGKSAVLLVKVNRDALPADKITHLLITSEGSTQSVTVQVEKEQTSSGGDNGGTDNGGGTSGGGETIVEDYSSATVESCDYRIGVKIVSCKRSGSSVVFTYTIKNEDFGDLNDFRIYPPSSQSLITGAIRSVIMDNEGNQYPYPTMTYADDSTNGVYVLGGTMLEGVTYKCTIVLKDVPNTVTSITAIIGVWAYAHTYKFIDHKITFENVPIY